MRPRDVNLLATAAASASLIFVPLWADKLRATTEQLGFIVAAYNGAVLVASYVFGRAADVHGSRRILQAGLALGALAAFLPIFSQDPISALLTPTFRGFCVGMYPPAPLAYAHSAAPMMGNFVARGSPRRAAGS